MNSNWSYSPETPNLGRKCDFIHYVTLQFDVMTLNNNRAPFLCYFKLCASFHSHWWIQTGVTVRKRPIWVKFYNFYGRVTLKCDVWPWKIIGHLLYATSSFVHYFVTISEFKLELQSGNAQFGSNSTILRPCDLEMWRMTLKNYRAPLLCYFKLCAAFRSHWWIQTGVTVQKRLIWVEKVIFFAMWPCNLMLWPWTTIGHLFYATLSFVHHFIAIGEFKLELQSGNAHFGSNSTIFRAVWPWNLMDDLDKQ